MGSGWLADAGGLAGIIARQTAGLDWTAFSIAILIPLLLVYGRNEIRRRRLRNIASYVASYPETKNNQTRDTEGNLIRRAGNPSLEFVTSKYMADLEQKSERKSEENEIQNAGKLIATIEQLIHNSWLIGNRGDMRLLVSSVGFVILSYFGFHHLFQVISAGLQINAPAGLSMCTPVAQPVCTCTAACPRDLAFAQLQIVGSLAFAGALIASLRTFVRSLAIFDLSAYTFLWQSAEILASVLFVIFLYRAFPDPVGDAANLFVGAKDTCSGCRQVPLVWLALAPLLGLLPQSATKFLLVRMQSIINWIKLDDDRFNSVTRSIPLDVIDGIDYTTRFRLEECGIYDVQNLATYNPILLYIECPYGIYQTIDWVAQSQLCSILGLERFLLMREMHVRTIFDLERAIEYTQVEKDGRTTGSPDEFDMIYAGILFAATRKMRDIGKISGIRPLVTTTQKTDGTPTAEPAPAGPPASTPPIPAQPAPVQPAPGQPPQGMPGQVPPAGPAAAQMPAAEPAAIPPSPLTAPAKPEDTAGAQPPQAKNDIRGTIAAVDIDAYCLWARQQIQADSETTKRCVEHLMSWMADDLHVRRLRRIWQEMGDSLGGRSEKLANKPEPPHGP